MGGSCGLVHGSVRTVPGEKGKIRKSSDLSGKNGGDLWAWGSQASVGVFLSWVRWDKWFMGYKPL